jgi:hypothetical protein
VGRRRGPTAMELDSSAPPTARSQALPGPATRPEVPEAMLLDSPAPLRAPGGRPTPLGQQPHLLADQHRAVRPVPAPAGNSGAAGTAPGSGVQRGTRVRWADPLTTWQWFCRDDPPALARGDEFTFVRAPSGRQLGAPALARAKVGHRVRWAEPLEAARWFCAADPPAAACADVPWPHGHRPASGQRPRGQSEAAHPAGRGPMGPAHPLAGGHGPTGAAPGSPATRLAVHSRVRRGGGP